MVVHNKTSITNYTLTSDIQFSKLTGSWALQKEYFFIQRKLCKKPTCFIDYNLVNYAKSLPSILTISSIFSDIK